MMAELGLHPKSFKWCSGAYKPSDILYWLYYWMLESVWMAVFFYTKSDVTILNLGNLTCNKKN